VCLAGCFTSCGVHAAGSGEPNSGAASIAVGLSGDNDSGSDAAAGVDNASAAADLSALMAQMMVQAVSLTLTLGLQAMDGASNAPPMPPLASGRLIARTLPDSNDRRGGWFSSYRATGLSDMEGMVTSKGYAVERHEVVTRDGYILTVFRIPGSRGATDFSAARPPVLLAHGISLSSTCWVVNEARESLGFVLADQGYDVWMMNTRGNTYAKGHKRLTDSESEFWAFSADQMALVDLPATIDYILQATAFDQVSFVGHSQGCALMLALLAKYTEYNEKISVNIAMAPVVHAKLIRSPMLVSFFRSANQSRALNLLPPQEYFFMSGAVQQFFLNGACQVPISVASCVMTTEAMFGQSSRISTMQYKRYWQSWPSSTSYWNALQWSQMYSEPKPAFTAFNYGPEYNLTAIRAPTVLFSGGRDVLAADSDIALTRQKLAAGGSLAGWNAQDDYSHMDFIWDSEGASRLVYPLVLRALASMPAQQRT